MALRGREINPWSEQESTRWGFTRALVSRLNQAITFPGRASRRAFRCFTAFHLWLWSVGVAFLCFSLLALACFAFASVLPLLSVTVRRLHRVNRSAIGLPPPLAPFVGSYALSVLLLLPGSGGPNACGPEPMADPNTT